MMTKFGSEALAVEALIAMQQRRCIRYLILGVILVAGLLMLKTFIARPFAGLAYPPRRAGSRRVIDLSKCDFSPTTPVKMLDVNADHEGDAVAHFVEYSPQRNRQLVNKTLRGTRVLNHSHTATINRVCKYPETCRPAVASHGE
jgi:hypothetical protein